MKCASVSIRCRPLAIIPEYMTPSDPWLLHKLTQMPRSMQKTDGTTTMKPPCFESQSALRFCRIQKCLYQSRPAESVLPCCRYQRRHESQILLKIPINLTKGMLVVVGTYLPDIIDHSGHAAIKHTERGGEKKDRSVTDKVAALHHNENELRDDELDRHKEVETADDNDG